MQNAHSRKLPRLSSVMVLVWGFFACWLAFSRSFWGDELIRWYQSQLTFYAGVVSLFAEPSPFSPGEMVLNRLCRLLFDSWLPAEIWGRLPGISWGMLTLVELNRIAKRRSIPWLPVIAAFSVTMTSLSVLMRPYGSLIFAGVLATGRLDRFAKGVIERESVFERALFWYALAFVHIYGVCYLALSSLFRKGWLECAMATLWVVVILNQFAFSIQPLALGEIQWFEILRNTVGCLTNPHKVAPLVVLLVVLGSFELKKTRPKTLAALWLLLVAATLGPIFVTVRSGYFFVPRQVAGALGGVWYLSAVGLLSLSKSRMKATVWPLVVLISVLPWFISIMLRKPPYPDQPIHQFRALAHASHESPVNLSLFVDVWNWGVMLHYLEAEWGARPSSSSFQVGGQNVARYCFGVDVCFDFATQFDGWPKTRTNYDRVYYSLPTPPPQVEVLISGAELIRTW